MTYLLRIRRPAPFALRTSPLSSAPNNLLLQTKAFDHSLSSTEPITPTTADSSSWMHGTYVPDSPLIRINDQYDFQTTDLSHYYEPLQYQQKWPMYQGQNGSVPGAVSALQQRNRGHSRQASDSTIASTGPNSPYTQNISYPFIANTDRSPTSATYLADESLTSTTYGKTPNHDQFSQFPVGYLPSQLSHTPAAHFAMKNMAIDHHNSADDLPDYSSRRSASSHGRNSPSTPRTTNGDESEDKLFKTRSNDYRQGPRVELYRTESAAFQDELYNPANFLPSSSAQPSQQARPQNDLLSPHRNLVNERIKTANSVRSQSPAQLTSRDRSPFRQGSPLAPAESYNRSSAMLGTAAASRQQQKEQADAREYAQHQPQLRREATKTISPKDAVLDYNESDQDANMPLFTDTIPMGYQKHYGGSETYPNNFVSATNQAYGQFATSSQQNVAGFRATSADGNPGNTNFSFLPPAAPNQLSSTNFPQQQQSYRLANSLSTEQTPEFPAHLTSMESSMSENGAMPSSQESSASAIRRPSNTSANTGTYTCTYHGCALRFESPAKLQKHKREAHQPNRDSYTASAADSASASPSDSASPRLSESPDPSGMTSAALLARNSQAGPHKCSRINPSTGKPCNTIFSRPYDLTRHEDTIHNRGKQKVRCQYCREEKTFSRNDALTRHMRVVHPEVDFQGKRGRRDY